MAQIDKSRGKFVWDFSRSGAKNQLFSTFADSPAAASVNARGILNQQKKGFPPPSKLWGGYGRGVVIKAG